MMCMMTFQCLQIPEEPTRRLQTDFDDEEHDEEIACVCVCVCVYLVLVLSVWKLRRETGAGAEDATRRSLVVP